MSKLFDIKPKKRDVKLRIKTYNNNRILKKILNQLKKDGFCKIQKNIKVFPSDLPTFEIFISSNEEMCLVLSSFKNEIVAAIPDLFPQNYRFDLKGGDHSLGFVKSFDVYHSDGHFFTVYHRIKEMRKNGDSLKESGKQINF